jgi:hypothetical protein
MRYSPTFLTFGGRVWRLDTILGEDQGPVGAAFVASGGGAPRCPDAFPIDGVADREGTVAGLPRRAIILFPKGFNECW